MLPAAPDACPALYTITRTSPRGLTSGPAWVVPGTDVPVTPGVVVAVGRSDADVPPPDGPLSITCSNTMPRTTARPISPAPRMAELTLPPSRTPPPPPPPTPPPTDIAVTATAATA